MPSPLSYMQRCGLDLDREVARDNNPDERTIADGIGSLEAAGWRIDRMEISGWQEIPLPGAGGKVWNGLKRSRWITLHVLDANGTPAEIVVRQTLYRHIRRKVWCGKATIQSKARAAA